jgi:hypothetical protein
MELLASVHWVATRDPQVRTVNDVVAAVARWNDRKKTLMKPQHLVTAWDRLQAEGWLKQVRGCPESEGHSA